MLPGFSIIVTPDGLKAYLQIPPKTTVFPTEKDLCLELQNKSIITGINMLAIAEIAQGKRSPGLVEIAKGIPPQPGTPAKIEIIVDMSGVGKPKELVDGRVDHHEIGSVINIAKGVELARRIPPAEGIDGRNVFGKAVSPPMPENVQLIARSGTCIAPDNPDLLLSSIDGALLIGKDNVIEVRNEKIIENDIDYATGNINFAGDLVIKGSVRAGFFVEVLGNLRIYGNVEDTRIKSGGSVEIDGGAVGAGTGIIECHGSVKVRHLENFSIKSGENVFICEDALHSNISSNGKIKAKSIIGGSVNAFGVDCESIGCARETRTTLDIGRMHLLLDERDKLMKKDFEISELLKTENLQLFVFVRDSMDEKGLLSEQDQKKLELIKNKTIETKNTCDKIKQRIEIINGLEKTLGAISGISARCIYPNTLIKFGNGERQVQDVLHDVKLFAGT